MQKSWQCHRCRRVWAPHVKACSPCNQQLSETMSTLLEPHPPTAWNFTGDDQSYT